jgi:large subunit ribosomal protein L13
MKTKVMTADEIKREWFVIDANNQVLGRLASEIAKIIIGKNKPSFSPNQDHGDYIIVVNSDKVVVTGKKEDQKTYFRHSTYPGGGKFRPLKKQRELDSTKIIVDAVHGMVSKNPKGRAIMKKLFAYAGDTHPHAAQQPKVLSFAKK